MEHIKTVTLPINIINRMNQILDDLADTEECECDAEECQQDCFYSRVVGLQVALGQLVPDDPGVENNPKISLDTNKR